MKKRYLYCFRKGRVYHKEYKDRPTEGIDFADKAIYQRSYVWILASRWPKDWKTVKERSTVNKSIRSIRASL